MTQAEHTQQQIVELDPAALLSVRNNRLPKNERDVDDLLASINKHGQILPIEVTPNGDGTYTIVSGHRRTYACKLLGITVKAIISDIDDKEAYMRMLIENETREDTNPIEKAHGFAFMLEQHDESEKSLAQSLGTRVDVVKRHLALLQLNDDIQKLVADGYLGITYAAAMAPLEPEFQRLAMRAFNNNDNPRPTWFRRICGDLESKQNQSAFSFGDIGNDNARMTSLLDDIETKHEPPPDPANYTPSINPLDIAGSVRALLTKWKKAGDDWKGYGRPEKAKECAVIVDMLQPIADAYAAQANDTNEDTQRIYELLQTRGEMTTKSIMQYGNVKSDELAPVLDDLVASGRVARRRSGRGYRYAVAQ